MNTLETASAFVSGILAGLILSGLLLLIAALPTMVLWNMVVTAVFGLPTISVWQAMGLLILGYIFSNLKVTATRKE